MAKFPVYITRLKSSDTEKDCHADCARIVYNFKDFVFLRLQEKPELGQELHFTSLQLTVHDLLVPPLHSLNHSFLPSLLLVKGWMPMNSIDTRAMVMSEARLSQCNLLNDPVFHYKPRSAHELKALMSSDQLVSHYCPRVRRSFLSTLFSQ